MDKTELEILEKLIAEGLECCNVETGDYFRVIGVIEESGKPVLQAEFA